MRPGTSGYITMWATVGVGAVAATALLTGLPTAPWAPLLALTVAVAAAERVQLTFAFDRVPVAFSVVEVAITAGLLLVPPAHAVASAVLGLVIADVTRLREPPKVLFNAAQVAASVSTAAIVVHLTPTVGPLVADRPVLGAALGMAGYVTVNLLAMRGLLLRVGGPAAGRAIRAQQPLTVTTIVGLVATGIVLAALLTVQPVLAVLVLAPVAAIHLAARGTTRTTELLARVRDDRDRLTRVIDGATDGIVLLDRDGTVQLWNRAMVRLTGQPEADVAGRAIAEVFTDGIREADDPVRGRWLIDTADDLGPDPALGFRRHETETRLRHRDGTVRTVRESHALLFDAHRRCSGDVVVVHDVSQQQQLERLRSDFVARISHELRTPLTPIRGFVNLLLRRGDTLSEEQRRDALTRILERTDHLGDIVEDLLLVTRLDDAEPTGFFRPQHVDPGRVLVPLVQAYDRRETSRRVRLSLAPGTGTMLADPSRVRQVVDALLDNACRYSPADTDVDVSISRDHGLIDIRVHDQGPGIPAAEREAVFERFHRLEDPMTMRTGGVGLGLFLARRLAEAMGGQLRVDDTMTGTTVRLSLPATAAPDRVQQDA